MDPKYQGFRTDNFWFHRRSNDGRYYATFGLPEHIRSARLSINKILATPKVSVNFTVSVFAYIKGNYSPSNFIDITSKGDRMLEVIFVKIRNSKMNIPYLCISCHCIAKFIGRNP